MNAALPYSPDRVASSGDVVPMPRTFPFAAALGTLLALALGGSALAFDRLVYDREAILAGEVWRALSGHWVHLGPRHLFLDAFAFFAAGAVCETRHRRLFAPLIAFAAALSSAFHLAFLPELRFYCGLSGLCSVAFVWAGGIAFEAGRARRDPLVAGVAIAALGCLVAKIAFECATGAAAFAGDMPGGWRPLPEAHAVGAALGAMAFAVARRADPRPKGKRR